jgi:hypothetical protein
MGVNPKKRARAPEAPQSQEREEGPSTEPANPPLERPDSTPGGAKEGSQVQTEEPPRLLKQGGMAKYYRKLARKAAKKAKLEKGKQTVKAPEEPGAKTSEENKEERGGGGTERGLEVGVEGNELLIYTHQIGEKAEILRREEGRAENEKERAQRSWRLEIERQSRRKTRLKKKGGAGSRRWEMERQLGRRASLKRTGGARSRRLAVWSLSSRRVQRKVVGRRT